MTEQLSQALVMLAAMQNPSVADLLRKHGYAYEASRVEEVIHAWQYA